MPFNQRRDEAIAKVSMAASIEWDEKAEQRVDELAVFIAYYNGEIISGMVSDPSRKTESGMVFPDSVQVRVKMTGEGFRDLILNFPHLFEVDLPPDVQPNTSPPAEHAVGADIQIFAPPANAPAVCVIDSGIQEDHRWLVSAMDAERSRCFLPGVAQDNVADFVSPSGHGTRVAGAVLFPLGIPAPGGTAPVAWLQNARVLDNDCKLPKTLPPEKYLNDVVEHFNAAPHFTKIFNHSINSTSACPKRRMTPWAAKMDQLSHQRDVLFIQSAGNQNRWDNGDQGNTGLAAHLNADRVPPSHQLEDSMRIANPGQSLHALTVGSISQVVFENADAQSFATAELGPSGFSRAGYGQPWDVVKPEVVEIGGDLIYSKGPFRNVRNHSSVSIELINSTRHGAPHHSKDGAGTSFAAPKVAHIAAHLQTLFPTSSPLLYRALIVQSARWPKWAENAENLETPLRLIGYGIPSLERATSNDGRRVTLITPDAVSLRSKQFHFYTLRIPEEMRNAALEAKVRIEVTLAYTALPRRTRSTRRKYLEAWLDWESNGLGETGSELLERMQTGKHCRYPSLPWHLHTKSNRGEIKGEANRNNGSVQKDWAVIDAYDLPEEFSIAVRSHRGWNHLQGAGIARYCLVVSFEVVEGELPVYNLIRQEVEIQAENEVSTRIH